MSNTLLRIISSFVMVFIVMAAVYFGKSATLILVMLVGLLCLDELLVNFSNCKRISFTYIFAQVFFGVLFLIVNLYFHLHLSTILFLIIAICLNFYLLYYLFKYSIEERYIRRLSEKHQGFLVVLVMFHLLSLGVYFESEHWREILVILLMVTFSMDTGAWFFGKNFGKRKLWPKVSPKKTIEGFVGGVICSGIVGTSVWIWIFKVFSWKALVLFSFCGAISQGGDLIQSKIKREFEMKDSSNLIPGHGGMYDRIDSLIFLSPFFVVVVKYLGQELAL